MINKQPSAEISADKNLRAAIEIAVERFSNVYDPRVLQQLKIVLSNKLTQASGTSLRELTNAVQNISVFGNREQAELVAKTISFHASNLANKRAWQQSGVVKTIKWWTAEDGQVCEFCGALDGMVIRVSDNFVDKGAVLRGKNGGKAIIESDIETPPLHDGCRCYCRPEIVSLDDE